jgi:hypothetical protein
MGWLVAMVNSNRRLAPTDRGMGRACCLLLATLLPIAQAHADELPSAAIRAGNHTNFGRIVFDVPPGTRYKLTRDGDTVTLKFPDQTVLQTPPPAPRNVRSLKASAAQAELQVAAGAALREMRVDGHVVIDVLDPAAVPKPAVAPPKPSPKPAPEPPKPPDEPAPVTAPDQPPSTKPADVHAAAPPPPSSAPPPTGPVALVAVPNTPPQSAAITVPFAANTGAAVFRRGTEVDVVFDERRPIDLAALRGNPVFGAAIVRELPSGTLIVLHPAANTGVALTPTPAGWQIAIQPAAKTARAIPYLPKDGRLDLPAEAPGSVVSMADPTSGATLLVGTMRRPGQAILTARRTAEFALPPTELGIVVEPLADSVALRTVPSGFQLTGGPNGLAITQPNQATEAAAAAVHLTSRFKLPAQSPDALRQAVSQGVADAAAAPPGARGPKRRSVASAMLSLGMGAEAQSLLRVAAEQDPKEAASPETTGLAAIAALLANRPADAAGIDDPRLSGTDEIALWRAIGQAQNEDDSANAAAAFASAAPLALQYPSGIRDRILPLIAETMVLGGEAAAAKRFLALAGDAPGLGYARALMRQADGDAPGALAALDALATGHDQRDRARAATRAVEVRLAAGLLDAAKAAEALDKLRYAWRGDRRELALRERIADLHQRAGAWRTALADLRSAQADYPDRAQAIQTHLMGMFITLLYSEAADALPPLDLVALADENADLFKAMPSNEDLQARLADRLMALDLPSRAAPLLEKLATAATTAVGRATFGARLADLRLREGDAAGSLAALASSAAPGLDPALAEQRGIAAATAKSRLGDSAGAIEALAGLTGVRADTARAATYEQAGNWPAAEEALMLVASATIPATGELTDSQRQLVLRLATAAQRSGDRNGLLALRATHDSRLGSGPLADMIRLLTADPVQATADLPRAEREMGFVRGVPAALAAFKAP